MKLDSDIFDSIRVRPKGEPRAQTRGTTCQRHGCDKPGTNKAPMGRGHEGEFYHFCIDHVREYNKNYNYFDGMSNDDVIEYQKSSMTGHRPTWSMGTSTWSSGDSNSDGAIGCDPHDLFGPSLNERDAPKSTRRRPIGKLERRYLRVLNLEDDVSAETIKARFKLLVKRHHPDANGGDRGSEDKLREVIQAYNYLKQAGLC